MPATDSTYQTRQVGKMTVTVTPVGVELRRSFDAPRRLVWEVLSSAEHYPRWWGPRSQRIVSCELDFRPGGAWRIVTSGGDDVAHGFRGVIREIAPLERIVQTFEYEGAPGTVMLDTLRLTEEGGRTHLHATSVLESGSPEAVAMMVEAGMVEGAAETYDRLEELVAALASEREVVIARTIDAPRERVFAAWTSPEADRWWGPRGFTTTTHSKDVRPGGIWRYDMRHPEHGLFPNRIDYLEVSPPERLLFDHGSGIPGDPGFRAVVTFEERGGRTTLTLRQIHPSVAARDKVVREYRAIEGGNQTLDRLEEHLAGR